MLMMVEVQLGQLSPVPANLVAALRRLSRPTLQKIKEEEEEEEEEK